MQGEVELTLFVNQDMLKLLRLFRRTKRCKGFQPERQTPVLVAPEVAARTREDFRVTVNYDFPNGLGRTGRIGSTGLAYSFLGDQDAKHALDLIKILEGTSQEVPPQILEWPYVVVAY